jgi:hypothetical protein
MEMFYLVLAIGGSVSDAKSAILIPEKYSTEQACKEAGKASPLGSVCIRAPKSDDEYNCMTMIPDPTKGMGYGMIAKIKCGILTRPN